MELNILILLVQQSVPNFAHGLIVLTDKIHNTITNKNIVDNIKFTLFVSSTSSKIKIKLQKEKIGDYRKAVECAQTLQQSFKIIRFYRRV